ncbi:MAG: amidophosphoribosyltransferase [Candidatus Yanofskybacteria bacterium]|nr:amidophosphoribosyltransferase [Candidatus Yanofskybacteria bacterium]
MCGIFGAISAKPDPRLPEWVYFGLSQLQHRGQESVGVAYSDGDTVYVDKEEGLVSQVLTESKIQDIQNHNPNIVIGHVRYSTSKGTSSKNIQPQFLDTGKWDRIALVHNGNIPGLEDKKRKLSEEHIDISSKANDTEFMLRKIYYLSLKTGDLETAIQEFMKEINGSYSAALMTKHDVFVFRDPWEDRPLFISSKDGVIFFASETCALKDYSANIVEVSAGRRVKITPVDDGFQCFVNVREYQAVQQNIPKAHCVFEKIYFARPDSRTFSQEEEGSFRFRLGRKMANSSPVPNANLVSGIPESGRPAAQGFAFESKIPYIDTYIRNSYMPGRTFINPNPSSRAEYSRIKYHLEGWAVKDKCLVLVDDSIVRGNTMRGKVAELFNAGAKEVHLRISSPRVIGQCFYGIDIPTREELVAFDKSEEEIRKWLGATSLKYLPVSALEEVLSEGGEVPQNFCKGCFTGEYPIPLE